MIMTEKYLLTASLRRDGISDFQSSKKWGFFSAVSAGWVVSSRDFFEKYASVVDYLKIKAGYGEIGNGNAAPSVNQILFQNRPACLSARPKLLLSEFVAAVCSRSRFNLGNNRGIRRRYWIQNAETTGLFGTLEFYRKLTDNVILPVKLPTVLSPGDVYLNAGTVEQRDWGHILLEWQTGWWI